MTQAYPCQQSSFTPQKNKHLQEHIQEEKTSLSPKIDPPQKTEDVKRKSLKQRWDQLSKMSRAVCITMFISTIILVIFLSCYIYVVTQGPKFPNAPVQIEAVYQANNEKIVYYYFKMNQPSFIRVGKLVQGYAEAVYYLYTGMEYQPKTVGRITIMHRLSGIILKAFNPRNIEMQYDLETILQDYASFLVTSNKRLLLGSESTNTTIPQSPKASNFEGEVDQAITAAFASILNVQASTLQNNKEATLIGVAQSSDSKQQLFQIISRPSQTHKTKQTHLQTINNKEMTVDEQTQLVNDIIQKVVEPVLKDLLRQIVEYGPSIAEEVGVIFDDSVDLRVTYEKVIISDGSNNQANSQMAQYGNQLMKIITRQTEQVYANKPINPTDTKTMTQRCFSAINSCTNLDQNTKMCTKQEWQSDDTPFTMTNQSKQNEQNYQEYSRNKVTTRSSLPSQRRLL